MNIWLNNVFNDIYQRLKGEIDAETEKAQQELGGNLLDWKNCTILAISDAEHSGSEGFGHAADMHVFAMLDKNNFTLTLGFARTKQSQVHL